MSLPHLCSAFQAFSKRPRLGRWAGGLVFSLAALAACAGPLSPPPNQPATAAPAERSVPSSEQLPIGEGDISWGHVNAPVTIVAFLDLQCPFCARVHPTIVDLLREYGVERVRLVVKHAPLPFHERGIPAAKAAQAVYRAEGADVFWRYVGQLFDGVANGDAEALSDARLATLAEQVGVVRETFVRELAHPEVAEKVKLDLTLYERLGGQGVPAFYINGAELTGARPAGDFKTLIEHELAAADELKRRGVEPATIYQRRVQVNYRSPRVNAEQAPFEDVAYRVPVGDSPAKGSPEAPVTIVEFADFECPFCARAHATVEALFEKYPGKIRWVMKHNPLPFHPVAVPAAITALEVKRQKGDAAYWQALARFYTAEALTAELLLAVADEHGLEAKPLLARFESERLPAELQADQYLAMDLAAQGTPHFFVNGRRLAGAQPLEVFEQLVTQELEKVAALGLSGDVYSTLQADALPPPGLVRRDVPPLPADAPSLGPAGAPVTIQMFSDFECPYCQRVLPTIAAIREQYPDQVRLVWRHLPLPFHQHAKQASAAALEAKAQRGEQGFWAMAERMMGMPGVFLGKHSPRSGDTPPPLPMLTAEFLREQAKAMGLSEERFSTAIGEGVHLATIAADEQAARKLGVNGTPAFFINGYFLSGAQPFDRFERLVRLAIDEAKDTSPRVPASSRKQ